MHIAPFIILAMSLFNHANATCCDGMTINQAGLKLVESSEGCVQHVYNDAAGNPTVCYGHLLRPGESFQGEVSMQECQNLLKGDLSGAEECVRNNVNVPLNSNQFSALTDFTYNLGCGTLQSSTLLQDLNGKDYAAVPQQMSRFVNAGGRVLPGLVTRRQRESQLWNEPESGSTATPEAPKAPQSQPEAPKAPQSDGSKPTDDTSSSNAPTDDTGSGDSQQAQIIGKGDSSTMPTYGIVLIAFVGAALLFGIGLTFFTYRKLQDQAQALNQDSLKYQLMPDS